VTVREESRVTTYELLVHKGIPGRCVGDERGEIRAALGGGRHHLCGSAVYFSAAGARCVATSKGSTGTVVKVPLAGGSSSTLATGQSNPGALVVDVSSLYDTTEAPGDAATAAVVTVGD
jgi:hypothetical protein